MKGAQYAQKKKKSLKMQKLYFMILTPNWWENVERLN